MEESRRIRLDNDELEREIDELKQNNTNLRRDIRTRRDENSTLTQQINDAHEKINELERTENVFNFIMEILNAPNSNVNSNNELNSLIEFIRGEVRCTVKSVGEITQDDEDKYFGRGLDNWALLKKRSWLDGKKCIAFIGEFSAGKTSIVNQILSQDNSDYPQLPVSVRATTAIPTYISFGNETSFQFVTPNDELKVISQDILSKFDKNNLDRITGLSSLIKYLVINCNTSLLNQLCILDTPGFSSNDSSDADRTQEAISTCDALFWVIDVNAGTINRSSIEVIRSYQNKPLYIIINKIDTKHFLEVDEVEAEIKKTLSNAGVDVKRVLRFSKNAPPNDLLMFVESILRDIKCDDFPGSLYKFFSDLTDKIELEMIQTRNSLCSVSISPDEIIKNFNFDSIQKCIEENLTIIEQMHHLEINWFSDNEYTITEGEYKLMWNKLEDIFRLIGEKFGKVATLYECFHQYQDAVSDYLDKDSQWNRLNECRKELEKKLSDLLHRRFS